MPQVLFSGQAGKYAKKSPRILRLIVYTEIECKVNNKRMVMSSLGQHPASCITDIAPDAV
ncbi:MAG: hypothetical protein QM654_14735 [Dysgonamonadaceae bacterium]